MCPEPGSLEKLWGVTWWVNRCLGGAGLLRGQMSEGCSVAWGTSRFRVTAGRQGAGGGWGAVLTRDIVTPLLVFCCVKWKRKDTWVMPCESTEARPRWLSPGTVVAVH